MTNEEEMALREYAAGRACTQSVIDALGPMSLWSKSSFDAEIRKAVEAEREACAKICDDTFKRFQELWKRFEYEIDMGGEMAASQCAKAIRARGTHENN